MKILTLEEYGKLDERIKPLAENKRGIIVFDIDDTVLKVDTSALRVYKKKPGEREVALTTSEFAKDPDAGVKSKLSWFDFRDMRNPEKVYEAIITGTPLLSNIRIIEDYVIAGYEFAFLTARACEEVIKDAIWEFLKEYKGAKSIGKLGHLFNKTFSAAVNDQVKEYEGETDSEKKSNVLRKLAKEYDKVVFIDDDKKNVIAARELGIPNLIVLKAWETNECMCPNPPAGGMGPITEPTADHCGSGDIPLPASKKRRRKKPTVYTQKPARPMPVKRLSLV